MRMPKGLDDGLTWLSPKHDPAPRLMVDNNSRMRRNSSTRNNQLLVSDDLSLYVKVEGGHTLTTPPKPKKKEQPQKVSRHNYKDYNYNDQDDDHTANNDDNSHYSTSKDPSTESLLASLAPYFENEEALRGLDRDTIRQLLQDHPELAEAARDFEKARVNKKNSNSKESSSGRVGKGKPKKRFNSSKNDYKYDEGSSMPHHNSHLDGLSHLDVMKEAGIPVKSWFIVCLLLGAGVYQLRKIILEPSNNKRNTRKKGKSQRHDNTPQRQNLSTNKSKSKVYKNHLNKKTSARNKQNNETLTKANNKITNSIGTKALDLSQPAPPVTKINGDSNYPHTQNDVSSTSSKSELNASEKKTKKTGKVISVSETNTTQREGELMSNDNETVKTGKNKQDLQPKSPTVGTKSDSYDKNSVDEGVTTSADIIQHESLGDYCEEDRNAIIEALNDDSSLTSSNGEWQIAGRKHRKRQGQQNKINVEKPKHSQSPPQKSNGLSGKNVTPKNPTKNTENVSSLAIANEKHEPLEPLKEKTNESVTENEDCHSPLSNGISSNIDDKTLVLDNDVSVSHKIRRSNTVHGTSKDSLEKQKGSSNSVKENASILKDDTVDDAALALKLQREEELLLRTEKQADEQWEVVKTKRNKKASSTKETK